MSPVLPSWARRCLLLLHTSCQLQVSLRLLPPDHGPHFLSFFHVFITLFWRWRKKRRKGGRGGEKEEGREEGGSGKCPELAQQWFFSTYCSPRRPAPFKSSQSAHSQLLYEGIPSYKTYCVFDFVNVCPCRLVHMSAGAQGSQKRASESSFSVM